MNFGGWFKGPVILAVIGTCIVLGARAGWYWTSTLSVTPFVSGNPASGVIYFLPLTVIDVEATYQVTKCDVEYTNARYRASIEASVTAQFSEITEPDFARGYTIEARSFDGGFWNTDFAVEISKGFLKAVNAEAKSIVVPPKKFDVNELVKIATRAIPDVEQASSETSVEEVRKNVCGPALIEALSNPKESKLDPKDDKPKLGATTMRRIFRIVPGGRCPLGTEPASPPAPGTLTCIFKGEDSVGKLIGDSSLVADSLVKYSLEMRIADGAGVTAVTSGNSTKGLVYRIPGSAFVTICLCSGVASATRVLAERTIAVSQFGPEAVIEVERRMFSDRKTHLEFGDNGELKKAAFSDAKTAEAK